MLPSASMIIGRKVEFRLPNLGGPQRGTILSALDSAVAIRLTESADAKENDRAQFCIFFERGMVRMQGEIVQVQGTVIVVEFNAESLIETPAPAATVHAPVAIRSFKRTETPRARSTEVPEPSLVPPPRDLRERRRGQDAWKFWINRRIANHD